MYQSGSLSEVSSFGLLVVGPISNCDVDWALHPHHLACEAGVIGYGDAFRRLVSLAKRHGFSPRIAIAFDLVAKLSEVLSDEPLQILVGDFVLDIENKILIPDVGRQHCHCHEAAKTGVTHAFVLRAHGIGIHLDAALGVGAIDLLVQVGFETHVYHP